MDEYQNIINKLDEYLAELEKDNVNDFVEIQNMIKDFIQEYSENPDKLERQNAQNIAGLILSRTQEVSNKLEAMKSESQKNIINQTGNKYKVLSYAKNQLIKENQ